MIRPMIHRQLTRGDLACLVDEIARMDVSEGREADEALQAGAVDTVLDSPAALEAVLGRGGAPAPLPLTLLWYIPIRAQLRTREGMVRAYVTFAGRMLALAADLLEASAPEEASLCARAAEARIELHAALIEARADYIGDDPHSSESRLNRFLRRLE